MAMHTFLPIELRIAFQRCARRAIIGWTHRRAFSANNCLLKKKDQGSHPPGSSNGLSTPADGDTHLTPSTSSTELVPGYNRSRLVSDRNKIYVPTKIMPKAQVSPNLTLSPVERMRIEYITRNPPKPEPKKIFRERLLIYHGGLFRTNLLAIIKVWTMIVLFGFATVVVPAYYVYGSPWWVVGFLSVAGLVPFVIVNVTQRPFVTWIHLHLPVQARLSPKAAMEYARNLPGNAVLHISFQRWTALGATVEANLADLVPAKGVWWRPVTFEWVGPSVDKGSLLRPNSTRFYVKPKTGTGKEARDTIPGIWELVYKNITGIDSNAVKRWRK